jgi:hypothetical protein
MDGEFSIGVVIGPNGDRGDYYVQLPGHIGAIHAFFGFPIKATFTPGDQVILLTLPGQHPVILGRANSQRIAGTHHIPAPPPPRPRVAEDRLAASLEKPDEEKGS